MAQKAFCTSLVIQSDLSDEPCGGLDFTGLHWVQ